MNSSTTAVAALAAEFVSAERVIFGTDVEGVFTSDPRLVQFFRSVFSHSLVERTLMLRRSIKYLTRNSEIFALAKTTFFLVR